MGLFSFISEMFSDTYTDENGYKRYKDSGKLVHRYMAEKKLGRKLRQGEVVHHRDRDKSNNSKYNLWVFKNQEAHERAHRNDAKRYGRKASYRGTKKDGGFWDLFK
jgi:hypothetical protein